MESVKALFFNESLRHWHFNNLLSESGLSRERISHFLNVLQKEKFIKRVKPRGRMPFYVANRENQKFRVEKRLYGLKLLEDVGLLEHIILLDNVRTAIIFGSFARGDWNKSSDVDIFMFGDTSRFEKGLFERKLKHEIQLFSYSRSIDVKRELEPKLFANIIKGVNLKESIAPFEVAIHA